jgi:hypothetical protein
VESTFRYIQSQHLVCETHNPSFIFLTVNIRSSQFETFLTGRFSSFSLGSFLVRVTSGGVDILGSPFAQTVLPGRLAPDLSKLWMLQQDVSAGEKFFARLQFQDRYGNNRTDQIGGSVAVHCSAYHCTVGALSSSPCYGEPIQQGLQPWPGQQPQPYQPPIHQQLTTLSEAPGLVSVFGTYTRSGKYYLECTINGCAAYCISESLSSVPTANMLPLCYG